MLFDGFSAQMWAYEGEIDGGIERVKGRLC